MTTINCKLRRHHDRRHHWGHDNVPVNRPSSDQRENRACGCLLGLAVGDALGTTLEFRSRDTYPPLTDMIGGGPFNLALGEWTDDTSMALCLADSLIENGDLDETDLMRRFVRWWSNGENSATGWCFDIGGTTSMALGEFAKTGNPRAGSRDPNTAGNGSLMRLAPVAIRHHCDRARAIDVARRQSVTTHAAPAAVDACAFFAGLLVDAISGAERSALLSPRGFVLLSQKVAIRVALESGTGRDSRQHKGLRWIVVEWMPVDRGLAPMSRDL